MPRIEFTVNGEPLAVEADGATPLLWILRDTLGLTGTKYGCGEGVCGACTVLEDGVATRSCQILLRAAAGHAYTTIEGLSKDVDHPVQRVWLEESVAQCGFCQPGMILEVVALTRDGKRPAPDEIEGALSEHVCRCGTYPRIRRAVLRLAGSRT